MILNKLLFEIFLLKIIIPIITTLICIFPILSHPLSIGLTLLVITILGRVTLGVINTRLWISYAIILVLLGGLLVIFIYVALLASNEIFIPNPKIIIMRLLIFLTTSAINFLPHYTDNLETLNTNKIPQEKLEWLSHLYSIELSNLTLFLITYLLLTLIVVVSNTKNNSLSLRSSV